MLHPAPLPILPLYAPVLLCYSLDAPLAPLLLFLFFSIFSLAFLFALSKLALLPFPNGNDSKPSLVCGIYNMIIYMYETFFENSWLIYFQGLCIKMLEVTSRTLEVENYDQERKPDIWDSHQRWTEFCLNRGPHRTRSYSCSALT